VGERCVWPGAAWTPALEPSWHAPGLAVARWSWQLRTWRAEFLSQTPEGRREGAARLGGSQDALFSSSFGAASDGNLRDIGTYEYDAVAALGLLICRVSPSGALPSDLGTQIWAVKEELEFHGLSGRVRFDAIGNRDTSTANYQLTNVILPSDGPIDLPILAKYGSDGWEWNGGGRTASGLVYNGGMEAAPIDIVPEGNTDMTGVVAAVSSVFGSIMLIIMVAMGYRLLISYRKGVRAAERELAGKLSRISAARENVNTCNFFVCFISFKDFRAQGKLIEHEAARSKGLLHWLDTYDDVQSFIGANATAFFSHQWLARKTADPKNVHFNSMCDAAEIVCEVAGLEPENLYLWVDTISIPQRNSIQKSMSIQTIGLYASISRYFIVIAPHCLHADSGKACDAETYQKRGWCRLEQWARMTIGGLENMYIFDDAASEKHKLTPISHQDGWYYDSIHVMHGDFTVDSDKDKLVDTLLGLWSVSLENRNQADNRVIYKLIMDNKSTVFPEELFGDLIPLLEERVGVKTTLTRMISMASGTTLALGKEDKLPSTRTQLFSLFAVSQRGARTLTYRNSASEHGQPGHPNAVELQSAA